MTHFIAPDSLKPDSTKTKSLRFEDIQAAAKRLAGQIERTPMRHSQTLSEITGAKVFIKFENLQFTAAFKERGALNKLLLLDEVQKRKGVVAASAGNHAQGLAYHGARLGVPTTIVMPRNTPMVKIQHTRNFGGEVMLEGETYDEANQFAEKLCQDRGLTFVHPFNDYDVMAGQGSIALEMLEDVPDLDILPIPIGGGGLISGMALAAKSLKPDIRILGVESAMYPSFTARWRNIPANLGGQSIAEGIAVKQVGELCYGTARPLIEDVLLIEESDFESAIALYCNVEKTVAEGAGAASLAALLAYPDLFRDKVVGLVLCGGNIDSRLLASVLTRELVREQRIVTLRLVGDDRPGLLAMIAQLIGEAGGNIISFDHNRLALDVPAKGAEFDIQIETRDANHSREVIEILRRSGFPPRLV